MRNDVLSGAMAKKQAEERLREELQFKAGLWLNYLLARPLDKVWKGGDWWQFVVNWMRAQGQADVVYMDGQMSLRCMSGKMERKECKCK
jgi:hypothetical protein